MADCPFYNTELREVRGSGALALMEREWCTHPKNSPCTQGCAAWHSSPAGDWRNLECNGEREMCPLTLEQYEDGAPRDEKLDEW